MAKTIPTVQPRYVVYGFFILGLLSAIGFRSIIIFEHVEPSWVRPVWYMAVVGYILFFLYRYRITRKRKTAIRDFHLIEKIRNNVALTEDDREVAAYLLSSLTVSPEGINYFIIFLLSVLAIVADFILSALG
jgi:hypothetical protein